MVNEPDGDDDATTGRDAAEACEDVVGEPISREEAMMLGLTGLEPEMDETGGSRFLRVDGGVDSGAKETRCEAAATAGDACPADPEPPLVSRSPRRRVDATSVIMWLVLTALLAALAVLATITLSVVAPEQYARFRDHLPAGWTFLPKTETELRATGTGKISDKG